MGRLIDWLFAEVWLSDDFVVGWLGGVIGWLGG